MPLQLSWYLENRVMLVANMGEISDQDFLDLDHPILNYINQSNAPLVHMIWTNDVAKHTISIKTATALQYPKHPRCGWSIIVGMANPMQRFIAAVANTFFKSRMRMINTMDEALDFLNDVDSTLPALRSDILDKAS